MGLFFNDAPKRVSKEEFKKVRAALASEGMQKIEIDKVEEIFLGDIYETTDSQKGVDRKELEARIKWMRENMSKHRLSEKDVSLVEEKMSRYL